MHQYVFKMIGIKMSMYCMSGCHGNGLLMISLLLFSLFISLENLCNSSESIIRKTILTVINVNCACDAVKIGIHLRIES